MISLTMSDPGAILHANNDAYEWLLRTLPQGGAYETDEIVLRKIEKAAQFAVEHHTGRFADGALENPALQIGRRLSTNPYKDGPSLSEPRAKDKRRVIHVTRRVYGVGGHTRMIGQWVSGDPTSYHFVILLDQGEVPVPSALCEVIDSSKGEIIALPSETSLQQKSMWLRSIAQQGADLVVLHHFGSDVIPTVAFAVDECPPVAVLNHADHLFWLGSSVADIVVNLRTIGSRHTKERRYAASNLVLPIPLNDAGQSLSRREARAALGIPEGELVLLSVARGEKYRPCGTYDFFSTAAKILDSDARANLYIVGETEAGAAPYMRVSKHERLHFVGILDNPGPYQAAADVYLESFPSGSQTALLEAALSGLPVVPAYAPMCPLLVANDDALSDVLPNPPDEGSYVERARSFMRDPDLRASHGQLLRERLLVDHVGAGWQERLAEIYRVGDQLRHSPREIPVSKACTESMDIGLSVWHALVGRTYPVRMEDSGSSCAASHIAYAWRTAGAHRQAWLSALRSVAAAPMRLSSWRLIATMLSDNYAAVSRRLRKAWFAGWRNVSGLLPERK